MVTRLRLKRQKRTWWIIEMRQTLQSDSWTADSTHTQQVGEDTQNRGNRWYVGAGTCYVTRVKALLKNMSLMCFWDAMLQVWIKYCCVLHILYDRGDGWLPVVSPRPLLAASELSMGTDKMLAGVHQHLLEAPPAHYLPVVGGDPPWTDTRLQLQRGDWVLFIRSHKSITSLPKWLAALFWLVFVRV